MTPQPVSDPPVAQASPARRLVRAVAVTAGALVALIAFGIVVLSLLDWDMLRGPIGRMASARLHREVRLEGPLKVHLWSWSPSASIGGLRVANPDWAGPGRTIDIPGAFIQIHLAPLFRGRLDILRLEADRPTFNLRRDAQGRETWNFSGDTPKDEPLRLPPIRRFVIHDGRLNLTDDKRKLQIRARIDAAEQRGGGDRGFTLDGAGRLNGAEFSVRVLGGPLLEISPDKPYPFDADIRAGSTRILAQGRIDKPFDLGHLSMKITARGPDLAQLYDLTGVPFPNTPPYDLSAGMTRNVKQYSLTGLRGRLGDTDLSGDLAVDARNRRPVLTASLKSRRLDFDDLMVVFGGRPLRQPAAAPAAVQGPRKLLPDATLKADRIRALDADVTFSAASVRDAVLPLRSGSAHIRLKNGILTADPVAFELPQGRIAGSARLDARQDLPVTAVDLRLTNARLQDFVPAARAGQALAGGLVARVRLSGAGESVHRAASNASGDVTVVIPSGEIRKAFAELLGVNVTRGLGLLLSKNEDKTSIRCGVAHFKATGGVLRADTFVLDTGPVLATGSGTIDLGDERLDLSVKGHPKQFRLVRLSAPIEVKGPITAPHIGVSTGQVVAQGGVGALLATLASPLAALLPFVDPGLAHDASCGALIQQAGKGAPAPAPAENGRVTKPRRG